MPPILIIALAAALAGSSLVGLSQVQAGTQRTAVHASATSAEGIVAETEQWLARAGVDAIVTGRIKSSESAALKMQRKGLAPTQIMDRVGVRVRVDTVADCYAVMDMVRERYAEIDGTADDYIEYPKPSGYQSLHMAVVARVDGVVTPVEFQVRTHAMHADAETGRASHRLYKLAAAA